MTDIVGVLGFMALFFGLIALADLGLRAFLFMERMAEALAGAKPSPVQGEGAGRLIQKCA